MSSMTIDDARRSFAKFALDLLFAKTEFPIAIEQIRYLANRHGVVDDVEYVMNRDLTSAILTGSLHDEVLRNWFHSHALAKDEVF